MNKVNIPKIVWMYWGTGWETAPYVVKCCADAAKHYASDWNVVFLTDENVGNYLTIPNKLYQYPVQIVADWIRMALLEKYGGVWIDASAFLNTELTPFVQQYAYDFLCPFRWENKVSMSNWFLVAKENSFIARTFKQYYEHMIYSDEFLTQNKPYFQKWKGSPNYFCFHRLFADVMKQDLKFGSLVKDMPFLDSTPLLHTVFNGWNKDISNGQLACLAKAPIIKLAWTTIKDIKELNPKGALPYLLNKMNGMLPEIVNEHIHTASDFRTVFQFTSYVNNPLLMKDITGIVDSEGDLKLSNEPTNRYHILNFSSLTGKDNVQLLIPYKQNRLFIRYQTDNTFIQADEFVTKKEMEMEFMRIIGGIAGLNKATHQSQDDFYTLILTNELSNYLKQYNIAHRVKIGEKLIVYNGLVLEPNVTFFTGKCLQNMGAFSYTNSVLEHGVTIGRYCSIGKMLKIFGAEDFPDWISTSPQFYKKDFNSLEDISSISHIERNKNNVIIGNDVWIGDNVTLKQNIKIGNGAIIAANAVVTKDVPDFAIVGGVPAKLIRYRFSPEIFDKINQLQWWQFDIQDLKGLKADNPVEFLNDLEIKINKGLLKKYIPSLITCENIMNFNQFYYFVSQIMKEKIYDKLIFSHDFSKHFYQIYIKNYDKGIHYELLEKKSVIYLCLHFEGAKNCLKQYVDFIRVLSKNSQYVCAISENKLSVEITLDKLNFPLQFKRFFEDTFVFSKQ